MNKRIKKKRWLDTKVAELIARMELTFQALMSQRSRIESLEEIQSKNTVSTNNRFDKLERELAALQSENQSLRFELDRLKMKTPRFGWK